MTGFVRGALAVTAGLALLASSAMAGVPSPANSDVEAIIVGNASGNPLGKAGGFGTTAVGDGFVVVVRDIGGAPINGANVTINFSTRNGTSGLSALARPYTTQVGGATVDCPTQTVSLTTGPGLGFPAGTAIFRVVFSGAENSSSIEVRANGVLLGVVMARSTDADGNGTTGLADLGIFQANLALQGPESDFDLSGVVGLADLGILQAEIASAAVRINC